MTKTDIIVEKINGLTDLIAIKFQAQEDWNRVFNGELSTIKEAQMNQKKETERLFNTQDNKRRENVADIYKALRTHEEEITSLRENSASEKSMRKTATRTVAWGAGIMVTLCACIFTGSMQLMQLQTKDYVEEAVTATIEKMLDDPIVKKKIISIVSEEFFITE